VHCVDLGESFPTHIFLQNLASIQQRTSLVKFLVRKSFSVLVRQQAERLVKKIHRAAYATDARKSDERAADGAAFLDSIN